MRRIRKGLYLVFILSICLACQKNNDKEYFNGKILNITDHTKNIKETTFKELSLDGINYGFMSVYDSLMVFMNPKLKDCFFNVFNVKTGKDLGTFLHRGIGPNEVSAIHPIYQFFKENNDLKTLLFAINESELIVWNISQSITQRKTVIDTIIPYSWKEENKGAYYQKIYRLNKDTLLAYIDAIPLNEKEATLPFYQKRTIYSNKLLTDFPIYKEIIKNGNSSIIPEAFLSSCDALKPDGSRVAQAMRHLPQLNIINTQTGQVIGYRSKEGDHFSVFESEVKIKNYYIEAQADNNYIYATYYGKEAWGQNDDISINTIHVFDWNGNLIQKIRTDKSIDRIALDTVENRLYSIDLANDQVYYLDLNEIFN